MANWNKKNIKRLLFGEFSVKRLMKSLIFIYAFLCFYGFFFSERLIFQPPPSSQSESSEVIKISSANGVKISTVHFPNAPAKYTILYSHGNAENLDGILWLLKEIRDSGFAVFAYDYQGYGTSQGKPSEYNIYRDIDAAYNYLTQHWEYLQSKLFFTGVLWAVDRQLIWLRAKKSAVWWLKVPLFRLFGC
jgi:hypothetical protein